MDKDSTVEILDKCIESMSMLCVYVDDLEVRVEILNRAQSLIEVKDFLCEVSAI